MIFYFSGTGNSAWAATTGRRHYTIRAYLPQDEQ